MFKYNYHRILCAASNADLPRTMTREQFKEEVRIWRSYNHVKLRSCSVVNMKNNSAYYAAAIWSKFCPIWIMSAMNGGFIVKAKAAGAEWHYQKSIDERRELLIRKRDTIKNQRKMDAWNEDLMNVPVV